MEFPVVSLSDSVQFALQYGDSFEQPADAGSFNSVLDCRLLQQKMEQIESASNLSTAWQEVLTVSVCSCSGCLQVGELLAYGLGQKRSDLDLESMLSSKGVLRDKNICCDLDAVEDLLVWLLQTQGSGLTFVACRITIR